MNIWYMNISNTLHMFVPDVNKDLDLQHHMSWSFLYSLILNERWFVVLLLSVELLIITFLKLSFHNITFMVTFTYLMVVFYSLQGYIYIVTEDILMSSDKDRQRPRSWNLRHIQSSLCKPLII
jgi:hypothetical protein